MNGGNYILYRHLFVVNRIPALMCDLSEDETLEHVVLECVKYDKMEMINVILTELGCGLQEVIEKTGRMNNPKTVQRQQ